jgi:hypothetical protein
MTESTEPTPYFELALTHLDGRQIPPGRFQTVQDAVTAAMGYDGVHGSILLHSEPGAEPVEVIAYNADGSIAVGADVPDDDDEDGWTEEELAANFAAGREPTAAERAQFGITE